MHCTLVRTAAVIAVVGVAGVVGSTAHAAVAPAPTLSVGDGAAAGSRLDFSGTGFGLPSPASCEVAADAVLEPVGCAVDGFAIRSPAAGPGTPPGYPMARIDVPSDATAGTYAVRICVPTCASPWGGQSDGAVVVETADAGGDDGGAGGPPTEEPPTDEPPIDEPPTDEPPTDEPPTAEPGGGVPRLVSPAAPVLRQVLDVADSLQIRPNPVTPESSVILGAPSLPTLSTACVAQWEGEPADHVCTVGDGGVVAGDIAVPAEAPPGLRALVVCQPTCDDPVGGRATVDVAVTAVERGEPGDPEVEVTDAPATEPDPVDDVSTPSGAASSDGSAGATQRLVLGGSFIGLLLLLGLVLRLTWRKPPTPAPPRPEVVLRVIADGRPTVTTTLALGGRAGRPLRLRAIADLTPIIALEDRS